MSDALRELAAACGVDTDYTDWQGKYQPVSDDTLHTVLTALGHNTTTIEAVHDATRALRDDQRRRVLAPTVVVRRHDGATFPVHVPHGTDVTVTIETEDGDTVTAEQIDRWVEPVTVDGKQIGEATFAVPDRVEPGYHTVTAHIRGYDPGDDPTASALLIVTPSQLPVIDEQIWGVLSQVYQGRSNESWSVGDLGDLAATGRWAATKGADFVLVNPLHAGAPSGPVEPSPYLPTSRRFTNPMYLHIDSVPELVWAPSEVSEQVSQLHRQGTALNDKDEIDRTAAWALKREALELLVPFIRTELLNQYIDEEGEGLWRYATWAAIAEVHGASVTAWPSSLQNPNASAVAAFAETHQDRVRFHCWLQLLMEEQLARVQAAVVDAGMRIGVIHDLAVGVVQHGADAWVLGDALADGVTVGAPPDQFNQVGQDWGQPPLRPDQLAASGYAPYRDMLRTVLRDAGGIRVDHVMGLSQLWWIPEEGTPSEGTYVRYDHNAMIGILCLEAHRAGAVVIGEDLGVVEPLVRDQLRSRAMLGTSVLWFEWRDGEPLPADQYRELCLATITTHDLAPTAGYLDLAHVELRDQLGLLTRPVAEVAAEETANIAKITDLLQREGFLAEPYTNDDVTVAAHAFLASAPARLIGVALSDLVGDRRIINQPGTVDEHPNWRLPLANGDGDEVAVDDLDTALGERIIAAVNDALSVDVDRASPLQ